MAKRSQKAEKAVSENKVNELVTVVFADNTEQAKEYESLLKSNDILAIIKEQQEQTNGIRSIAVMVPEDYLDEAHVIIESQNAYDDFYDLALDDENDDYDELDFDDEF